MSEKDYETIVKENTELQEEVDRLKQHGQTLLGEKKQAAADAKTATEEMESMRTELQAHRDAPINELFNKTAPSGMAGYLRAHFDKYYTIAADEEGGFNIMSGGDKISTLTVESLRQLPDMTGDAAFDSLIIASKASGGGATGERPKGDQPDDEKPKKAQTQFGLR